MSMTSDAFVATAILDRLLHHSHVITIRGDSYRVDVKEKQMNAFPAHRDLKNAVQLTQNGRCGHEYTPPNHRADPKEADSTGCALTRHFLFEWSVILPSGRSPRLRPAALRNLNTPRGCRLLHLRQTAY